MRSKSGPLSSAEQHLREIRRQVRRQVAAIDFALSSARRCQRRVGLLGRGLARGDRRFQVLKAEIELVVVELLRLPPEVIAPELAQHMR